MEDAGARADLRCSTWTRDNDVDPVGTAGSYAGFVLIEWPLPWPNDVSDIPELAGVAQAARTSRLRLQALTRGGPGPAPSSGNESGRTAVLYRWDETKGSFRGRETRLEGRADDAAAALLLWLAGAEPDGTTDTTVRDVLLCGHGRRDRCCGALGTSLEMELRAAWGERADVRLWRTSHTGGHRFAPTAVLLPEGTMWGYLDFETLDSIVERRGDPAERRIQYRGCAGLDSRRIQAVEREVLALLGWGVLDEPRSGREEPSGRVSLTLGSAPSARRWEADVVVRRTLPVPDCGSPIEAARKSEDELEVRDLLEVSAGGV